MRASRISIPDAIVDAIVTESLATYPNEACGVLLGQFLRDQARHVTQILPVENSCEAEEQYHRFRITPADYLHAEKEAATQGLEIVGFYHSHPDHPALPSDYDRDHAFPGLSYIVVAVQGRDLVQPRVIRVASWELTPDRTSFEYEAELKQN